MDNVNNGFISENSNALSKRAFFIFKSYQKLFDTPQNRVKIRSLILFSFTILLGYFAYHQSLVMAREDFLKTSPPSLILWNTLFTSKNFVLIENSQNLSILEDIPYSRHRENELYLDQDEQNALLFRPERTFIFKRKHNQNSSQKRIWNFYGKSWEAFEKLQNKTFDQVESNTLKKIVHKNERQDPKLLNY